MNKGEKQVIFRIKSYIYSRELIYLVKKCDKQKIVRNLIGVKVKKYKNISFPIIVKRNIDVFQFLKIFQSFEIEKNYNLFFFI